MGPSVGWVLEPQSILRVTQAGTTTISLGTASVVISSTASMTIQLPKFRGSLAGAGAVPGSFVPQNITIFDASGAPNVTILPFPGETISSLTTVSFTTPYGAFVLEPDPVNGGSTVV